MTIHTVFAKISPYFRKKRFARFLEMMEPGGQDRILDVGGMPNTWTMAKPIAESIDLVDLRDYPFDPKNYPGYNMRLLQGDGCDLPFPDGEYDLVYSNSVIEHVGTLQNQKCFADEIRRAGKSYWVQTPAYSFPIEPHYLAPFIHWMPRVIQKKMARWFTVWGWMTRPTKEQVEAMIDELRLLRKKELLALFPDGELMKEKFCLFFTKSYIVYRKNG